MFKTDLENLCEVFLKNFRSKKIFVAAKVAASLDGQIALKSGESKWITSPESRNKVHELRASYDALLIGRNTIEIDNPSLNVRLTNIVKEIKLIVLDPSSTLLKKILTGEKYNFLSAHRSKNIFFAVKNIDQRIQYQQILFNSLPELHEELWNLGIRSLFVEGGAFTYSRYLQEDLVDRLHLFLAPSIIGSSNGVSWTGDLKINQLSHKKILRDLKVSQLSTDIYVTGRL
jgi:diaminohydroxyphosphoribosylaminopyrimidine deaminase / 5-amino-6-(5-phosphoribosylamino)uracil reductase